MDHKTYTELYQKLPDQYAVTSAQVRSAYQSLYDKILNSYNQNNFRKINLILTDSEYTAEILKFKIPKINDQDTLMKDFVNLLYKIITIYPIAHFLTQLNAASFLDTFLEIHRNVPDLTLDWVPFYKVIKFFFLRPESNFFLGCQVENNLEDEGTSGIVCLLNLSHKISKYFIDEYEIESNGSKIKTNTTEQLVKKCFTRISPNGSYTPAYLKFFAHLCPPHKNRYHLYIDYLLTELRDTSTMQCLDSIFMLIDRLIWCNIQDDFSFLIPIITQYISLHYIKQGTIEFANTDILEDDSYFLTHKSNISRRLSSICIYLFISPPTRHTILERLENLFITFRRLCHPSSSEVDCNRIIAFSRFLVLFLKKALKAISNEKSDKVYLDLPKKLGPTQEEIHKLLTMVCELKISLIRLMSFPTLTHPITIEITLDPSIVDRYFDFAYQCINLNDANDVAFNGWAVLTALVLQIDKSEKLRDNFESIFQTAACNFYRTDIQAIISTFFASVFSRIPFNKSQTVKGCNHFNFPKLAHLLVSNIFNLFRSLPSLNEKTSQLNPELLANILLFFRAMVQYCDNEVMEKLLPIFTSLPTDYEMSPSVYLIEPIVIDYCLYANKDQKIAVINAFKKQLLLPRHPKSRFRYLSYIYSTISVTLSNSVEDVKNTTDLLLQFTKDENKKIRKHAWKAISSSLSLFHRLTNLNVTLKPEKMKEHPLENSSLTNFDIKWEKRPDISELAMNLYNPLFDKMMTIQDPHEMDDLLKEIGVSLMYVIQSTAEITEGSINNEVTYALVDSIHNIPQLHRKSVPFKDTFLKCALRIMKDFHDHENTMVRIITICKSLFDSFTYLNVSPSNLKIKLLFNFFPIIDHKASYFNSEYIYVALNSILSCRKKQIIVPITDDIRSLFTLMVDLGTSTYRRIRYACSDFLSDVTDIYPPLFEPIIENLINKANSIPIDEFVDFLTFYSVFETLGGKDKLLCRTMLLLATNLDIKDQVSLIKLKNFVSHICVFQIPYDTPKANEQEYIDLLNEIEENYLSGKTKMNRTVNMTIMFIIFLALKHVYDVSDKIFEYIMKNVTHFDSDNSIVAEASLSIILRRRSRMTKEKISIKENPTIATFPNIFDMVSVKLPENGVYFPLELKSKQESNLGNEEEDDAFDLDGIDIPDDVLQAELDALDDSLPVESQPSCNFDLNFRNIVLKDEIVNIFETFEKVEIEWNIDESTKIFDTELYADMSNGCYLFKEHFNMKKYEFYKDDFLIKNMSSIFSSASNSLSDDKLDSSVQYVYIWEMYSITVGPYCIDKLKEISIKYLSGNFRIEVASKVLTDMLKGISTYISFWSIEDRIRFFKSVFLPVSFIVYSNPSTSDYAEDSLINTVLQTNPVSIAPILKIFYEFSKLSPDIPLYLRPLTSLIPAIVCFKSINFFKSIDQLKDKYISPFISQITEFSSNTIHDITCLFFSILEIVSFSDKKSPLYSDELEAKRIDILKLFEDIIELYNTNKGVKDNENLKKFHIKVLTSFLSFCSTSSYDVNLLLSPLIIKHLHTIFEMLNSSNSKDEESFIFAATDFIKNSIFIINTKLELDFVTSLIKELMCLALPMQYILLEALNELLEQSVCNIPVDDYPKYEELLLKYARFEQSKNLGNELRLKIAKILGIFEIRKCTMNCDILKSKNVDDNLVADEVLKAASIILNSFLFNKIDIRVTKAFALMEEYVGNKRSKKRDFFKNVSEIFIHRHSEFVLPEVEEEIIQYRSVVIPDYIC